MQDWAKQFYLSQAWRKCRDSYVESVYGLCERCGRAGAIVYHVTPLTPDNIRDPAVALGWDNLIYLCRECHEREHRRPKARYSFDSGGNIVYK